MSRLNSFEGRLGLPMAPTRMEQRKILAYSSSDDDSDDEDAMPFVGTGQLDDEEEQERILSTLHGEATEDNSKTESSRKRTKEQTDQEIADEYAAAGEKKKTKKPRPTLQPERLVGVENGLLTVKQSFPSRMKPFLPSSKPKRNRVDAAALFARKLVSAYLSYCEDLFPSLAPEDVLLKIESFGSKKQVRDYLTHLREDIRNAHVERLYGLERGESLIQQLQEGLREQDEPDDLIHDEMEDPARLEVADSAVDSIRPTISERTSPMPDSSAPSGNGSSHRIEDHRVSDRTTGSSGDERNMPPSSRETTATNSKRRIEDSSDEEEATFDQLDDEESIGNAESSPATTEQAKNVPRITAEDSPINGSTQNSTSSSLKIHRRIDDSSDEEEATFEEDVEPNKDGPSVEADQTLESEPLCVAVHREEIEQTEFIQEELTNPKHAALTGCAGQEETDSQLQGSEEVCTAGLTSKSYQPSCDKEVGDECQKEITKALTDERSMQEPLETTIVDQARSDIDDDGTQDAHEHDNKSAQTECRDGNTETIENDDATGEIQPINESVESQVVRESDE